MKPPSFVAVLLTAVLLLSLFALPSQAASVDLLNVMDAHAYQNTAISETAVLPYRIYLPDAVSAALPQGADNAVIGGEETDAAETNTPAIAIPQDKEYGLFIWLHDEDLRGDDNVSHIADDAKNGLINAFLSDTAYANDLIIIAPQCPADKTWTDDDGLYLRLLIDLVRTQVMQIPIDEDRIFVGGISMGATAGYELIEMQAGDTMLPIAAAYLVAGTTDADIKTPENAQVFTATRIYAFLSENDTVTPPESVRTLADNLITNFSAPFAYAVYPELGHEIWHQAFAEQDLMTAFMSTNKPAEPEPEPAVTTEAITEVTAETMPIGTEAIAPAETESVTEAPDEPLSIAGIEITSALIAYVIMAAACIIAVILLIAGLRKNNRVR